MNKSNIALIVIGVVIIAGAVFFFSRNNQPANDAIGNPEVPNQAESQAADKIGSTVVADGSYEVSTSESIVNWEGRKPQIVGYKDVGTLQTKSGSFQIKNGMLASGEIVLDMETLTTTKVSKGGTDGLTKHLKSEDFFDVANFPEATIKLLSTQTSLASSGADGMYDLEADITIKGITNKVILPVQVMENDNKVTIYGHAELDRTLWDIRFGSGKFFENLADNVIADNFGVDFLFIANSK